MQAGDFTAKKEIVWLERRGIEEGVSILSFEFRKQLFEYDEASNTFNKLKFPTEVWLPCKHELLCHSSEVEQCLWMHTSWLTTLRV